MKLSLPEFSLVLLVGSSGSGKSTFARTHFLPTEVVSSDACRGLVADDENDQSATQDAFEVLHFIVAKRLARRRLTVVDATNVQREARASLVALARAYHALPAAVVLDVSEAVCLERNRLRPDRTFGPQVVARQRRDLKRGLKGLKREGFRSVTVLNGPEEIAEVQLERRPLWNDRRAEHGPFDIIGDVHGCADELERLLERLGYSWHDADRGGDLYPRLYTHPQGRRAIFVGDLVDRGPRVLETVGLVQNMVQAGAALCVPGNHDVKLVRKLRGKNVTVRHGLETTLSEFDALPDEVREGYKRGVADFLDGLVSHYVLDDGKLVVAHAGLTEDLQGRASGRVREFALYGDTTGETDDFGLPVRHDWAADYRGAALVAYGHTPVPEPVWLNHTVNLDTGCVFGGALTALRYPELETVSVRAARTYAEPARPLAPAPDLTPQQQGDLLDLRDVTGKRLITTRLRRVVIREDQGAAALEALGHTVDPKWLVYLPPTMAAPTTARVGGLEHPDEAFAYYRKQGVTSLVCEEKHMGSRAVCVVCRNEAAAKARFGVLDGSSGVIYTRTGRPFFAGSTGAALQDDLLQRLRETLSATNFWHDFATDWVVLDAELTPWSYKAGALLRGQYAPTAAAAERALGRSLAALGAAQGRGLDVGDLPGRFGARSEETRRYAEVYRRYCWPVTSADDLKLAPFALLATEGTVHSEAHVRQLETLHRYLGAAPNVIPTAFRAVDLGDPTSADVATTWWEKLTAGGGEGVVVKPASPVTSGKRGPAHLVQPGLKVRGRDYLRLVYGPEYLLPENLERLRPRNVSAKRALALQEFALGLEALERFVRGAPLREVHECVAGVLALESEPLDPRL